MQNIEHDSILKLLDFYEDDQHLLLVTDFMVSDMQDLIFQINKPLEELSVQQIFYKMVSAVRHCHQMNIIHRDIKLDNFLAGCDINDIRLTDFGMSIKYSPGFLITEPCGTFTTVAPEVDTLYGYDYKVDCWALGIILFEMLTNCLPFDSHNES